MSHQTTSTLQLHFFNDANALDYLIKNLQTDEDFNGNNGLEYLDDKAKGFNSNQEYYLTTAFKKTKNVEKALRLFFDYLGKDSFYEHIEYILETTKDGYALAVMYVQD